MDSVTVAELKAKLSHYLREVRAGRSFTVLSRDIPVATLGPYDPLAGDDDLEIIPATEDPSALRDFCPPPLGRFIDADGLLQEVRADRDFGLDLPSGLRQDAYVRRTGDCEGGCRKQESRWQCEGVDED